MREILFKAKRKDGGGWVEGFYCHYGFTGEEKHYIIPYYASALYAVEVDPDTVCQYTELPDKNGKKIFDGDILDCEHKVVRVVWDSKNGTWDSLFVKYIECKVTPPWYEIYCHEWKLYATITGNIHDNPELLT